MQELQSLKNKILTLAIQGKLVPHAETNEPASVLVQKIQQEKEQLIQEKKLKKDTVISSVIYKRDDKYFEKIGDIEKDITKEIPFEIPKNWQWVRLGSIGSYKKGPFGSSLKKSIFVPKAENTIKVYEQKNAINKNHLIGNYYISKEYFEKEMMSFEVIAGDIIVSCAGTIGETYILPDEIEKGIINQAVMKISLSSLINKEYFLFYFESVIKENSRDESKGTAIKNIPAFSIFKQMFFPFPPLEEQKRIVKKVQELFAQIDCIEKNNQELDNLKATFKNKMLSLAIQGKLVPQAVGDEPASVLLQKIQKEKEQLIKEKKVKKDTVFSTIYRKDNQYFEKIGDIEKDITKEIPFEIPKNWQWVRLKEVVYSSNQNIVKNFNININTWILELEDIEKDTSNIIKKVRCNTREFKSSKKQFEKNDVLYSKLRPYLNKVIIADENGICTSEIIPFKTYKILPSYLLCFFKSNYYLQYVNILSYGVKMPRLSFEQITNIPFPFPPLEEQYRITQKIEEVFTACEKL